MRSQRDNVLGTEGLAGALAAFAAIDKKIAAIVGARKKEKSVEREICETPASRRERLEESGEFISRRLHQNATPDSSSVNGWPKLGALPLAWRSMDG